MQRSRLHITLIVPGAALLLSACSGASQVTVVSSATSSVAGATTARPSYNTGSGFFVANGKLYDANGHEFRIRGVNRAHWDVNSTAGIALSGANTVRWLVDFNRPASVNVGEIQSQGIEERTVPIVSNWTATCKSDPDKLAHIVQTWVSQASHWTKLDKYLIVNIANEWGPPNSTTWRDSYIEAIASLRHAGYTGPLLIDSGGCGQDDQDLVEYSQAVFNADPERNVMFALHLYGQTNNLSAQILRVQKGNPTVITLASSSPTHPFARRYTGSNNSWSGIGSYQISGARGMSQLNGTQPASVHVGGMPGAWTVTLAIDSTNWPDYTGGGFMVDFRGNYALRIQRLASLSQTTGAVYIVGEFGPGNDVGPSPTTVKPEEIITAAEANGIGWLAWAWDDINLSHCSADDRWFSMTYRCGAYTRPSDLTTFGREVVLSPTHGLRVLARAASVFKPR